MIDPRQILRTLLKIGQGRDTPDITSHALTRRAMQDVVIDHVEDTPVRARILQQNVAKPIVNKADGTEYQLANGAFMTRIRSQGDMHEIGFGNSEGLSRNAMRNPHKPGTPEHYRFELRSRDVRAALKAGLGKTINSVPVDEFMYATPYEGDGRGGGRRALYQRGTKGALNFKQNPDLAAALRISQNEWLPMNSDTGEISNKIVKFDPRDMGKDLDQLAKGVGNRSMRYFLGRANPYGSLVTANDLYSQAHQSFGKGKPRNLYKDLAKQLAKEMRRSALRIRGLR